MFERTGFLAGSDEGRLAELQEAIAAPGVRAVIAARGGYGLGRITHQLDLAPLVDDPRWLVGFSDVTALHLEATRVGVSSLHAHNLAGMGRGDAVARAEWLDALEAPTRSRRFEDLQPWRAGRAEGPIVGGNLTMLFTTWASRRTRWPAGAVLLLEDVAEAPYRVDRMLTAMRIGGALDTVSGIVLGEFTDCPAGAHGVEVSDVLRDITTSLGVPVLAGLPVGHGRHNAPVHLGHRARICGDSLELAPDDG
jgi:muramoyltetrapeptide carboxypeptidase